MSNGKSERGSIFLRLADKVVGVPAVWLAGILKRPNRLPGSIGRIGLLKTAAIGDTVLITAVAADLREVFPEAEIVLFVGASNAAIAPLIPSVDAVHRIPVTHPFKATTAIRRTGKYDVWIDFGQWPRLDALLSRFADARFRIGFRSTGNYRHYVYDHVVRHDSTVHEIENYRRLILPLGVSIKSLPRLAVRKVDPDPRQVTIHMFPGGFKSRLKEWPEGNWVALIRVLAESGYKVALTGAGSDVARARALSDRIGHPSVTSVAGELSLQETVSLLARSALVISVNTGIMHIAAALGCNLVALNGPTSVRRWGPLSDNAVSLIPSVPCAPCLNLGFEYACDDNACMRSITLDACIEAAGRFIKLK